MVGEPADAGPALGLHLVEIFEAGQVEGGVGSLFLGGFLADWVGLSEVIDAGDLPGLGALLGGGQAGQYREEGSDQDGPHCRLKIVNEYIIP